MSTFNDQIANQIVKGLTIKFLQGLTDMDDIARGTESARQTADTIAHVNKTMHTNVNEVSESIASSTARIKKAVAENNARIKSIMDKNRLDVPNMPTMELPKMEMPTIEIPKFEFPTPSLPEPETLPVETGVEDVLRVTIKELEATITRVAKENENLIAQCSAESKRVDTLAAKLTTSYGKMENVFNVCVQYKEIVEELSANVSSHLHNQLLEVKQIIEKEGF